MIRKYRYLLTAAAAVGAAGLLTFAARNDFGLGRNMEIAVNMMRELSLNYVDPVDPDRLMEGAAAGMVSDLDPYTEYIPEEGMQDFELLTTGKYGGIGALIRQKDDYVRIAQPYQGSPADKAGLKIGDKILSIDGKDAKGFTTEQVSSRLKGEPGSKVKVTVEHLDGTQQTAAIRRERIAIPGVPYAGWVADGIGYIRHSDFTEGCYEEMRAAIERLRTERPLKGLVLDYRSNGGGIMQEAVKILGMFVPKGTEVVSTKGRSEDSKQVFRTDTEPILADLPLTVLINGNSASAAEIVAGALQDWDRAVVVGRPSFGKGLVQRQFRLGDGSAIRVTVARYHTPSGRVIQRPYEKGHREEYYAAHRERLTGVQADSVAAETPQFETLRTHRPVYGGGGIRPDVRVEADTVGQTGYWLALMRHGVVNELVLRYLDRERPQLTARYPDFERFDAGFAVSPAMMSELAEMAAAQGIEPAGDEAAQSDGLLKLQIKALVAERLFPREGFYRVMNAADGSMFRRAVELLGAWSEQGKHILSKRK